MSDWTDEMKARLQVGFIGHVEGGSCEAEKPCLGCDIRSALEEIERLREVLERIVKQDCHATGRYEAGVEYMQGIARAALRGGEEHSKHPTGDYCVYCLSQWPCVEAGECRHGGRQQGETPCPDCAALRGGGE